MSYYKIAYESDSLDGLKSIQGGSSGQGAGAFGSMGLETAEPPPQQADLTTDASSGVMQAPPMPAEGGADFADNGFPSPPPAMAESNAMDRGSEEDMQPPPVAMQEGDGDDGQKDGEAGPPRPTALRNPKPGGKN